MVRRVLVVDDEPDITRLLEVVLAREGFGVETARTGTEALARLRQQRPDLMILDVMLPDIDGLAVLRLVRADDPQLPILMLTARGSTADQVQGLRGGADDYVVKPFGTDVLMARVHALLRRQGGAPAPRLLRFGDLTLDTGTRRAQRGEREIDLTTTEFGLLRQFLEHPRQVLSKDTLMARIWDYDFAGNSNVLEVYVKRLRDKLEASGEPRLIHTLRGAGYVLREP